MTADSENETGAPKRRGRIPQSAWPQILERYKSGATLSAIAREFDCTPSAISYIVRKAERSDDAPEAEADGGDAAPVAETAPQPPAPAPVADPAPLSIADVHGRPPVEQARDAQPRREGRNRLEIGGRQPRLPEAGEPPQERPDRGQRFGQGRPERGDRQPGDRQPQFDRQGGDRQPGDRFGNRNGADRGERLGQDRSGDRPERQPMQLRQDRSEQNDRADQYDTQPDRFSGDTSYPYHRQRTHPGRQEAQETPTQPADERMEATAKICADRYRAWRANPGEEGMQALADALHEMRKVIARMEIDMSASRRDEQRPIPVQQYRANRPPQQPRG